MKVIDFKQPDNYKELEAQFWRQLRETLAIIGANPTLADEYKSDLDKVHPAQRLMALHSELLDLAGELSGIKPTETMIAKYDELVGNTQKSARNVTSISQPRLRLIPTGWTSEFQSIKRKLQVGKGPTKRQVAPIERQLEEKTSTRAANVHHGMYFIDFRARTAASYGQGFTLYGKTDGKQVEVAGLHPASDSIIPYILGHVVPVPSETGASYGDLARPIRESAVVESD
jgi:hypothetical protein